MNVNVVCIAGNLTRDPEAVDYSGGRIAKFGLAINDKYKDKAGVLKESVTFVDCEAFGKTADMVLEYLRKGSGAFIEGKLKSDSWQTQDGQKRQKLLVKVERVHFGQKPATAAAPVARPLPALPAAQGGDDEPPF